MSPKARFDWVSTSVKFSLLLLGVMATPAGAAPVMSVTIVRSAPNPAVEGQLVTFTAGVNFTATQPATGTITLTDTFQGTPTILGTITLDPTTGAGTLGVSTLAAGLHKVVAAYGGDSNYAPGISQALQQTILSSFSPTTTTLLSSVNPSAVGESVTFSAAVKVSAPNTMRPTGTVTFFDGATEVGSATVVNGGGSKNLNSAAIATSTLAAGSHNIQAVYSGDNVFAGSTSAIVVQVVQGSTAATTTTALSASMTSATAGQAITFTAHVTSSASGTPTGTVTISDGALVLAQVSLDGMGQAALTTPLSAGTHAIAAAYGGDANFGASASPPVTVTVTPASLATTTTTLASSANPSTAGGLITLTATVTSASGTPTGTVTFQDGSSTLASGVTLQSGLATLNSVSLTAGTHSLSAGYSGDSNFAASSGTLTQVVNAAQKVPTTTNLSSSANPSTIGDTITFTATVSGTGGTPSGAVTFTVGSSIIVVNLDATGTAVLTTSALPVGITPVSAAYSGDSTFAGSTSAVVPQNVESSFSADPNPIPVAAGVSVGDTIIAWNAPQAGTVEVHVGSPTGTLFAAGGSTGSAPTGRWVTDGMTFYLQDTTGGKALTAANTLATLVVHLVQESASFSANPNPIQVAPGAALGSTMVEWNDPGAQTVEIHMSSPSGTLFAAGGPSGSAQTGQWVSDGLTFYLQDTSGGKALTAANTVATLVVHLQPGVFLKANPNPIPVALGTTVGTTTLSWNAGSSSLIEVHLGAPDGQLFAAGVSVGSAPTGPWVTDGMTFYLQDVSGGKTLTAANTLTTLVVHLQPQ